MISNDSRTVLYQRITEESGGKRLPLSDRVHWAGDSPRSGQSRQTDDRDGGYRRVL